MSGKANRRVPRTSVREVVVPRLRAQSVYKALEFLLRIKFAIAIFVPEPTATNRKNREIFKMTTRTTTLENSS